MKALQVELLMSREHIKNLRQNRRSSENKQVYENIFKISDLTCYKCGIPQKYQIFIIGIEKG